MKRFKCINCKKKFPLIEKSYFNKKLVCRECYKKLKEDAKSKRMEEKRNEQKS